MLADRPFPQITFEPGKEVPHVIHVEYEHGSFADVSGREYKDRDLEVNDGCWSGTFYSEPYVKLLIDRIDSLQRQLETQDDRLPLLNKYAPMFEASMRLLRVMESGESFAASFVESAGGIDNCDYQDRAAYESMTELLTELSRGAFKPTIDSRY
jgi:hypothetical protein